MVVNDIIINNITSPSSTRKVLRPIHNEILTRVRRIYRILLSNSKKENSLKNNYNF